MFNHDRDRPTQDKHHGLYRGVVEDVNDPMEAGRIRIRVYGVHSDDIPTEHLPWAEYTDPLFGGAVGVGAFFVPDVGSKVRVMFEGGDHNFPIYIGGAPAKPHHPEERNTDTHNIGGTQNYPEKRVIRTSRGVVIEINDTEDNVYLMIKHPSGSTYLMMNNGDIVEYAKGNRYLYVDGSLVTEVQGNESRTVNGSATETVGSSKTVNVGSDYTESVTGTIKSEAGGDVDIDGTTIFLN